jgi:hypothetical protein
MLTKVYSIKEAEKMFLTAGFREVKFRAWGPPRMLNNFPCSKLPLGKYLPYRLKKAVSDRWGWGMTFKAQK